MTGRFCELPFLTPVKLGFGIIENLLYACKKQGFEALTPRSRSDGGENRSP